MANILSEEQLIRQERRRHPMNMFLKKLCMSQYKDFEVNYFTTKTMRIRMTKFLIAAFEIYKSNKVSKKVHPNLIAIDDVMVENIFCKHFKMVLSHRNYLLIRRRTKFDMWTLAAAGFISIGKMKRKRSGGAWNPAHLYFVLGKKGISYVEAVVSYAKEVKKN